MAQGDITPATDTQAERAAVALQRIRAKRAAEYKAMMRTGFVRSCPLCGYSGEFAPVGTPPRLDGMCPSCNSRERHRLFKLWLDREKPITKDHRVLHFAPEGVLKPVVQPLAGSYVTADFMAPGVDLRLNIEALDLADGSFDVILAHQILEHVDHHKALAECFRVLSAGGMMIATTPIIEAWDKTYVNPAITARRDRVLHFGQADHSRYFGRDLKDDMRAAGFDLVEYVSQEPDVSTHALIRGETLFILTKPQSAKPLRAAAKTSKTRTPASPQAKTPKKG
jgi:SAM-dependent methyltransferase